jgi:hypothetical protein
MYSCKIRYVENNFNQITHFLKKDLCVLKIWLRTSLGVLKGSLNRLMFEIK